MTGKTRMILAGVALVVLFATTIASACPMCKDSIPSSDAQQAGSLPGGFNNSVYFLLLSFFAVAGTVLTIIVKAIRETGARPAFPVVEGNSKSPRPPHSSPRS